MYATSFFDATFVQSPARRKVFLTDTAKLAAAISFPVLGGVQSPLVTGMEGQIPSTQYQRGLDELAAKGLIKKERFDRFGGWVYTPLVDFSSARQYRDDQLHQNRRALRNFTMINLETDAQKMLPLTRLGRVAYRVTKLVGLQ